MLTLNSSEPQLQACEAAEQAVQAHVSGTECVPLFKAWKSFIPGGHHEAQPCGMWGAFINLAFDNLAFDPFRGRLLHAEE